MARPPTLQIKREDYPAGLTAGESLDRFLRALNQFAKGTSDSLSRGLTYGDNFAAFRKTIDLTLKDDWIPPTLGNSWVNYGAGYDTAGYRKRFGRTEVKGTVKSGTVGPAIFTLPATYAPTLHQGFATLCDAGAGNVFGALVVTSAGVVQLNVGGNTFASLACSFPASDPTSVPNGAFPLRLKNELPGSAKPVAVWLERALDMTASTNGTPVSAGNPVWSPSADQITISDVQGLFANRRYRLQFLVIGG